MISDNSAYYRRQKRSFGLRILFALLLFVVAATAYLLIDRHIVITTLASINDKNYAQLAIESEKNGDMERAGYALNQTREETLGVYEYVTPLGFSIVSQSEKWTGEKLVEVYEELLNNEHGDEITYISKIILYPGPSDIGLTDSNVAGTHSQESDEYHVFFDLPALLPPAMEYVIRADLSVIELYNMDAYDDISEAALTISHEYGHLFTMYYFLQNDAAARASEYYALRGFDGYDHDVFFDTVNEYYASHEWSIYEIAAEDYVQLMGSDTGKKTEEFPDIYDLATANNGGDYLGTYDDSIFNVFPQENINIPLADEVEGLRSYFYAFIKTVNEQPAIESADFNFTVTQQTSFGYTYYEIAWDKTSEDPDTLYTLVCYDAEGNPYSAVRTIHGDEEAVAHVGAYAAIVGSQLVIYSNDVPNAPRYFRLYVILPDGTMQSSTLFYVDF